jgi:hypothetical protein
MSVAGDLKKDSRDFTLPVLVRTYDANDKGQRRYQEEAAILGPYRYVPQTQSEGGGHIHAGRLLLEEFEAKRAEIMPPDPAEQLQKWAELRDKGTITPEYFEKKKAELLSDL